MRQTEQRTYISANQNTLTQNLIRFLRVVINNLIVWFVESSSQVLLGESQANCISNTLTKRTYTEECAQMNNNVSVVWKSKQNIFNIQRLESNQ